MVFAATAGEVRPELEPNLRYEKQVGKAAEFEAAYRTLVESIPFLPFSNLRVYSVHWWCVFLYLRQLSMPLAAVEYPSPLDSAGSCDAVPPPNVVRAKFCFRRVQTEATALSLQKCSADLCIGGACGRRIGGRAGC